MYARKNWVNFNKYTFLFASQNLDSMNFCGNFHWSLRSHYRTKIEIQRKNVIFLKAYKQVAHTETTRYYSNRFNNTVYLKSKVFSTLQERRGRFRKLQFRSLYAHSIMQKKYHRFTETSHEKLHNRNKIMQHFFNSLYLKRALSTSSPTDNTYRKYTGVNVKKNRTFRKW